MSATTTASAMSATCTGNRWILPIQDAACAVPLAGNYSAIMSKCCSPATVEPYSGDCGLYCLAQGQNVGHLLDCIMGNGGVPRDIFCNSANLSVSATAPVPTTASKTGGSGDGEATGTGTGDGTKPTDNGGVGGYQYQAVSKAGLGVLVVVFCSGLLGVVV